MQGKATSGDPSQHRLRSIANIRLLRLSHQLRLDCRAITRGDFDRLSLAVFLRRLDLFCLWARRHLCDDSKDRCDAAGTPCRKCL